MDLVANAKLVQLLLRIANQVLWLNRAIYRSGLATSQNGLILLFLNAGMIGFVLIDRSFLGWASEYHVDILAVCFLPSFMICSYLLLGQYAAGILKVDFGAKTGITFKQSLKYCRHSFRFLGVGASKLTEDEEEFSSMVRRCIQHGQPPQLMLCDPSSPVIEKLEGIAQATRSKFASKVRKSYTAIHNIEQEISHRLDVRQYHARDYGELPFFRLLFIDNDLCLASGGLYGNLDHGVTIPQILITKRKNPGLYTALERYYNDRLQHSSAYSRPELET